MLYGEYDLARINEHVITEMRCHNLKFENILEEKLVMKIPLDVLIFC